MSRQSAVLSLEVPDEERPDLPLAWLAIPANDSVKLEADPFGDAHPVRRSSAQPVWKRLHIGGLVTVAAIGFTAAAGAMALTVSWFSTTAHTSGTTLSLTVAEKPPTSTNALPSPTRAAVSSSEFTEGLNALRSQMRAGQAPGPSPAPRSEVARTETVETSVAPVEPGGLEPVAAPAPTSPSKDMAAPQPGTATAEIQALLDRAKGLLAVGDIAAARRLTEYAAVTGNGEALFLLAETFDPTQLARWRVRGVRADRERARSLYQQALQQGVAEAQTRLAALP